MGSLVPGKPFDQPSPTCGSKLKPPRRFLGPRKKSRKLQILSLPSNVAPVEGTWKIKIVQKRQGRFFFVFKCNATGKPLVLVLVPHFTPGSSRFLPARHRPLPSRDPKAPARSTASRSTSISATSAPDLRQRAARAASAASAAPQITELATWTARPPPPNPNPPPNKKNNTKLLRWDFDLENGATQRYLEPVGVT